MDIPSQQDWEGYLGDLDAEDAHRIFAGKSNEQVQADFRRSVIERTSELRFMPAKLFRYYMLGFKQYIEAGQFGPFDPPDAASCFISLVEEMLETKPQHIRPIMDNLMPTLERTAESQLEHSADVDIYGSFPVKLAHIKALYEGA